MQNSRHGSRAVLLLACASLFAIAGVVRAAPTSAPRRGATVLLMIDEKNLGSIPTSEVETTGGQMLRDAGMKIVDRDLVRANIKAAQQNFKIAGDAKAAVSLGNQYGAEIVHTFLEGRVPYVAI